MRVFAGGGDVGEKDEKCPDYTTDGSRGGCYYCGGGSWGALPSNCFNFSRKQKHLEFGKAPCFDFSSPCSA